jgi:chorismate-pyruvate lyase
MLLFAASIATAAPAEDVTSLARDLNARLLADPSATAVLQRWCAERRIADPATIRAEVERTTIVPPSAAQRARLRVDAKEPVGYRKVRLKCGSVVLSEAENWYVPARLTPEMRAQLAGDTPFGTAIKPLAPHRRTLSAVFHWKGRRSGEVLRHRALVLAGSGEPLAEVVETYQAGIAAGLISAR